MVKQTLSILVMSLRSLPNRLMPTSIIVIGIAGVVAVLLALLSLASGFESTLKSTGQDNRAIVLRAGSTSEINGSCLLYTSPSPRDLSTSRMPSSA